MLGQWAKNKFCPNDLKFGTLAFLVIKNDLCKNYRNRLKNKEVVAVLKFKNGSNGK